MTRFAVEDFDQSWNLKKNYNEEVLREFATPKNKTQKLGYIPTYIHRFLKKTVSKIAGVAHSGFGKCLNLVARRWLRIVGKSGIKSGALIVVVVGVD